jgi:hypothetical protein
MSHICSILMLKESRESSEKSRSYREHCIQVKDAHQQTETSSIDSCSHENKKSSACKEMSRDRNLGTSESHLTKWNRSDVACHRPQPRSKLFAGPGHVILPIPKISGANRSCIGEVRISRYDVPHFRRLHQHSFLELSTARSIQSRSDGRRTTSKQR